MSDYSSMATLQNNSQTAGFAAAVQRARLVAAKIEGGGTKRPSEDVSDQPVTKKLASVDPTFQQQQTPMSAPVAVPPRMAVANTGVAVGHAGPLPPNMMGEQTLNEYIRVPDKMVGLIIGRGGEQITRLQADSGCKIQMAPDSGGEPDRLCTLTGSREAIARAKDLVNQIVNHRGRENAPYDTPSGGGGMGGGAMGGGGGMGAMGMGGGGMNNPQMQRGGGMSITEEMMLPGPKVGLIIGKSGKTIKQLQEQSGAKMVVIQDGPNTEYEKPLRITGEPDKVEHAKQLVYELLAEKESQGPPRPYEDGYGSQDQGNGPSPNSTEMVVPKTAVGVVIGRGGDMIKKIQAETGARVQFNQERDDGPGDKKCFIQGKPHQVETARQMIEDLISSVNRREQEVRSGRGRGGGGGGGGPQRNGDRDQWQEQQQPDMRVTFSVSNIKCGLIIGKGGEVIKQINAQSGAHCELDRRVQSTDRNNRTFFIKGKPENVEACKRIILEKVGLPVNFMHEGNGGPNNGGPGPGGMPGGDYGYSGGGPPAWGYNPHWHQPTAPQPQVQINPSTGQPDYSQQWIDYYRAMGMMAQAEAIEQQMKQQQQAPGGGGGNPNPAASVAPSATPNATPASGGGGGGGAGAGGSPDYSVQWAEYYRAIGKVKEAEAIEAQIKLKQQQSQTSGAGGPQQLPQQPTPTPTPPSSTQGSAPMMSQYGGPQYPMYPGSYPPYQPYPYPGAGGMPQQDQQQQ